VEEAVLEAMVNPWVEMKLVEARPIVPVLDQIPILIFYGYDWA